MTRQRLAIEHVIRSSREHFTAEQIYFQARRELPSLAIGTVYRNLNQMVEQGQLRRLTMPGAADRFDRFVDPHPHLICPDCGCVFDCKIDGLKDFLQQKTGVPLCSYELTLCGPCPKCAAKNKADK
ncbi:MAG: transcriptional repressor [Firmicutes bacterium]|nr:transcriptional repressor [Bacillota bacterium]